MTDTAKDDIATSAIDLLTHYGFEHAGPQQVQQLVEHWLTAYPMQWLRLALIEALYQGRYKVVSVGQLLAAWARRGQPLYHFNHEFERLVCNRFPQKLSTQSKAIGSTAVARNHTRSAVKRYQSITAPIERKVLPAPAQSTGLKLPTNPSPQQDVPSIAIQDSQTSPEVLPTPVPESLLTDISNRPDFIYLTSIGRQETQLQPNTVDNHPVEGSGMEKYQIHQFVPVSESSGFCAKLSAIALAERTRTTTGSKV